VRTRFAQMLEPAPPLGKQFLHGHSPVGAVTLPRYSPAP
jgi:hypothetical protein